MRSPLYGVVTGRDEDGTERISSRVADKVIRVEAATRTSTLALEVQEDGRFEVLFSPNTWQKAQTAETWKVVASGHVGNASLEVNHA